jgi:hypothetical protein
VSYSGQHRGYRLNGESSKPLDARVKDLERSWEHHLEQIKKRAEERARSKGSTSQRREETSMATAVTTSLPADHLLHIQRDIEIDAPLAVVFEALLEQIGPANEQPGGKPFPFKLEPWPGGRWYRDLGNNTGHLWGHVMVIKPPTLLEITGPLCMSYAATNHVQWRLTEHGRGTRLAVTHRGIGEIAPEHREGMPNGWGFMLTRIKERSKR